MTLPHRIESPQSSKPFTSAEYVFGPSMRIALAQLAGASAETKICGFVKVVGQWSMDAWTDGFVTRHDIHQAVGRDRKTQDRWIAHAVELGAFVPCEGGWELVGFHERNALSPARRARHDVFSGKIREKFPSVSAIRGVESDIPGKSIPLLTDLKEVSSNNVVTEKEKQLEKPRRHFSVVAEAPDDGDELAAMQARAMARAPAEPPPESVALPANRQVNEKAPQLKPPRRVALPPRKGKVKLFGRNANEATVLEALHQLGDDAGDGFDRLHRLAAGYDQGFLGHAVWWARRAQALRQGTDDPLRNPVAYACKVLREQLALHGAVRQGLQPCAAAA